MPSDIDKAERQKYDLYKEFFLKLIKKNHGNSTFNYLLNVSKRFLGTVKWLFFFKESKIVNFTFIIFLI